MTGCIEVNTVKQVRQYTEEQSRFKRFILKIEAVIMGDSSLINYLVYTV